MLQELIQQPVIYPQQAVEIDLELEEKLIARMNGPFEPGMTGDELMKWLTT